MSSTAMRIKNSTGDISTIEAKINIGAGYGSTTASQGQWGSIDCEFVWYTLNIYDKSNNVFQVGHSGAYGHSSWEVLGNGGNYSLNKL